MRVRFAGCLLDTETRELTREGRLVPLSPKAFRLLQVLAERRPSAVSQTELRSLLWPDTMMGGTTLARVVSDLRAAIADKRGSGNLIRTVHRFGYAFAGTMVEEPPVLAHKPATGYAVQWGARLVPLEAGENVIGRAADALISVASPKVSRRHARILVNGFGATLEDLGSRNGTYLGELKIDGAVELKRGDRIRIGPAMLIFYTSGDDTATTAATNVKVGS